MGQTYDEERQELLDQNTALFNALESANRGWEATTTELRIVTAERDNLALQVGALEAGAVENLKRWEETTAKLRMARTDVATLTAERAALEAERDNLRDALAETKDDYRATLNDIGRVNGERIVQLTAERDALAQRVGALEGERARLIGLADERFNTIADQNTRIERLVTELKRSRADNRTATQDDGQLTADLYALLLDIHNNPEKRYPLATPALIELEDMALIKPAIPNMGFDTEWYKVTMLGYAEIARRTPGNPNYKAPSVVTPDPTHEPGGLTPLSATEGERSMAALDARYGTVPAHAVPDERACYQCGQPAPLSEIEHGYAWYVCAEHGAWEVRIIGDAAEAEARHDEHFGQSIEAHA